MSMILYFGIILIAVAIYFLGYCHGEKDGKKEVLLSLPPQKGETFIHQSNNSEVELLDCADDSFCTLILKGGAVLHISQSEFMKSYKRKV